VTTVVPADTPVKMPKDGSMVPTAVDAVLHDPPEVPSESVVDRPAHTCWVPVIAKGNGLQTTVAVAAHSIPVPPSVYVIMLVPSETPDTKPLDAPTVATEVLPLTQEPDTKLYNEVVRPKQTFRFPSIRGVSVGGNTVNRKVRDPHAPHTADCVPVMVYVVVVVIEWVSTPLVRPVVAVRPVLGAHVHVLPTQLSVSP